MKLPKLGYNLTPSRKKALAFTIYEDRPEERALYHKNSLDDNMSFDDKENILQPKVLALPQASYTHRRPLGNLNISEFQGHLSARGQFECGPVKLQELYQPKNFDNESRSVHKFNRLPSYVTPPRNTLNKILYRTLNEDDEVECRLVAKSKKVRNRSMSVGVNKGKAHLVSKNKFKIHAS